MPLHSASFSKVLFQFCVGADRQAANAIHKIWCCLSIEDLTIRVCYRFFAESTNKLFGCIRQARVKSVDDSAVAFGPGRDRSFESTRA